MPRQPITFTFRRRTAVLHCAICGATITYDWTKYGIDLPHDSTTRQREFIFQAHNSHMKTHPLQGTPIRRTSMIPYSRRNK